MGLWRALACTGAALALAGCGSLTAPGTGTTSTQGPTGTSSDPTVTIVDPSAALVTRGIVLQKTVDSPAQLCVGAVAASYPPQCGGAVLAGEFSWDDVVSEEAGGVRWSADPYYAVGYLDLAGGAQGTFTLSRPLSTDPPEEFDPPTAEVIDFPQLCQDPTVDVPDVEQPARTAGREGMDEEQALLALAPTLDGYVVLYVSDGGPTMNLVINQDGDLQAARANAREVFHGPLCVEQRDLPTESDVLAAQQALHDGYDDLHILSSGGSGVSGLLTVDVLVADQQTVDGIHEAVAPWLSPDQVTIWSIFQPLGQE